MPSCSGTQLSRAPQRQRHGHAHAIEIGARVARDERAARAQRVGVLRRPEQERLGHLRVEARPDRRRPTSRTRASCRAATATTSRACRPISAAGLERAERDDRRLAEPRRRRDAGAGGEHEARDRVRALRTAARRPTRPPSEWPTHGAGTASSASATASTASANGSSVSAARRAAAEPPWPGRSGTITRRSAARAGATRRQFEAMPPRPWTSTSGGPVAADEVAEAARAALLEGIPDPVWTPSSSGHILSVMDALRGQAR